MHALVVFAINSFKRANIYYYVFFKRLIETFVINVVSNYSIYGIVRTRIPYIEYDHQSVNALV